MKRLLSLLMMLALLCASCTALPAEERAFAVALCVEKENETWKVHGRIPTYQTGGGYLTVSGDGESLTDALAAMEAAAPMHLHLSQLRLLVLDEALAESNDLSTALRSLAERENMRLQCAVALTSESAKDVAEALKPTTGARLSKSIDVLLESRIEQGTILSASLADVIRMGERQSPVLMALKLEDKKVSLSGGYALTGALRMAERIEEKDIALLSLLLGQTKNLRVTLDNGSADVREISVKTGLSPDGRNAGVDISLRMTSSALTDAGLEQAVADTCVELLSRLSAKGCDVLGLGRKIIVHAEDMARWHDLDWPSMLRSVGWKVSVRVQGPV